MKYFLATLFLCYSLPLLAQGISGTVYDSKTKAPLEGASVYFEGTTRGGITDANGRFTLNTGKQISSPLIITYLGYTDAVLTASWTVPMEIGLVIAPESLGEVIITGVKPFTRKELMRAFKEQFLGTSRAAKRCKILNEDAIDLWYDVPGKRLIASSPDPIVVDNTFLGYEVRFRIIDFIIIYNSVSVHPFDRKQTTYAGTTFFKDKQEGFKSFEKRRRKIYKTSALRLMRTIALEDWANEDFNYYYKGFRTDPKTLFQVSDTLDGKKVKLENSIVILDEAKKQSKLIPVDAHFLVDGYGNFYPPSSIFFSGHMGDQRIGDLLPLDYDLEYIED
jgi:hypothetical protein